MFRVSDLRHKDIINVIDGKRIGYIKDIELDLDDGTIKNIILPGENRIFSLFGKNDDLVIDWRQIKKIGADVILVEINSVTPIRRKKSYEEDWEEDIGYKEEQSRKERRREREAWSRNDNLPKLPENIDHQ